MIRRVASLLILTSALLAPTTGFANCSVPTGTAGDQIYNNTFNVMQYCNGTNWINMGTNPGGIGTLTSGDFCTTDGTNVNCTLASPLTGTYGGTGVNNGSNTITLGGSVTYSGAHTVTWTTSGTTTLTLPTSGTLETTTLASGDIWIGNASSVATATALPLSVANGGTGASTLASLISLTADVSGTLPVANGGTGVTSAQGNGTLVQLGTSTPAFVSGDCVQFDSHGNVQDSGAACGTASGVTAVTHGGTGDSTLTAEGVLYGNGTSAVGITAAGTAGYLLQGNGASTAPSWTNTPSGVGALMGVYFSGTANNNCSITFTNTANVASSSWPTTGCNLNLPSNTSYIVAELWGGGGGGAGSGSGGGNSPTSASGGTYFCETSTSCTSTGNATFYANGGSSGTSTGGSVDAGGSASGGDINITGGSGGGPTGGGTNLPGGSGGETSLGGGGAGGAAGNAGGAGSAGTGSGGGGGGGGTSIVTGGGGGAGGYASKFINNPSSTCTAATGTCYYSIGSGGSAGSAGTSGYAGGAGGSGGIKISVYR